MAAARPVATSANVVLAAVKLKRTGCAWSATFNPTVQTSPAATLPASSVRLIATVALLVSMRLAGVTDNTGAPAAAPTRLATITR